MSKKSQKLAISERLELYSELKMQEVEEALRKGYVRDPVTVTLFGLTAWNFLAGVGISIALSVGAGLIARSLAPKAKPQRIGSLSGEVQGLMRSEQGVLIPEIYGGDPGDGLGGVKFPGTIIWASKLRKAITVSRQETGGGKFGGGQTQEIQQVSYDLDIALMGPRGPAKLLKEWGNMDVLYDLYGQVSKYEAEDSANTFSGTHVTDSDNSYSGGLDVSLSPSASVQFNTVQSYGAATRQTTFAYRTADGAALSIEITTNGTPQTVSFPGTLGSYSKKTLALSLNDGANVIKVKNLDGTHVFALDYINCFPGHADPATATGVFDPTSTPDPTYDPDLPSIDPQTPYGTPTGRHSYAPAIDPYGVTTGQTNQGGYADFAIYEGNNVQLQDPTIQADIDGKYGSGSTPAYRGRAYIRHAGFQLTRWQGVVPSFSQLWEHLTIKKLSQMASQWCARASALTGDCDFSGLSSVDVRGWLVSGRRYQPKEVMTQTEDIYDVFYTENEGQIIGLLRSNAPTITIPETDIGWAEDDENETVPSLTTTLANELELPRRVDVKFIDPDRDFETNTQGESRQITEGESQQLLEVAVTLTAKEADEIATRKLYRDYVEGDTHGFTLSWKYLYLYPGYVITTTRNGVNISMQLTEMKGGISLLECQAVTVETSLSDQNASTSGGDGFERPPVPIPAMTILCLLDIPTRNKDADVNNGLLLYIGGTPRTNTGQKWTGFAAYIFDVGWEKMAVGTLPATIGVISDLSIVGSNTSTIDTASYLEFDLYHDDQFTPLLESVSTTDLYNGANLLSVSTPDGDILVQFQTATQVSPNKWRVTNLLHGRGGTEHLVGSYELGRRVVLINEAIQPVPLSAHRLNGAYDWTGVTNGQSLDDAAVIQDYVWTGQSRKSLSIDANSVKGVRDTFGTLLTSFLGRARKGGGLRSNQGGAVGEETEEYRAQILDSGSPALPSGGERTFVIKPGTPQPGLLTIWIDSTPFDETWYVGNNVIGPAGIGFSGSGSTALASLEGQVLKEYDTFVEAELVDLSGGQGPTILGLYALGVFPPPTFSDQIKYGFVYHSPSANLLIFVNGVSVKTLSNATSAYVGNGHRLSIRVSETGVGFYVDYSPGSQPLYFDPAVPSLPLVVGATVGYKDLMNGIIVAPHSTRPSFIYTDEMQIHDFGSVQNPIEMDLWQWSALVGDGTHITVSL